MVGTAIAKKVWTATDPEYRDALAARRTAHYRMVMDSQIAVRGMWNEEFASRYLSRVASLTALNKRLLWRRSLTLESRQIRLPSGRTLASDTRSAGGLPGNRLSQ
jgi:hypothetical protein